MFIWYWLGGSIENGTLISFTCKPTASWGVGELDQLEIGWASVFSFKISYLPGLLSIYMVSIYLFIGLSIYHLSVYLLIYPFFHAPTYPSKWLSNVVVELFYMAATFQDVKTGTTMFFEASALNCQRVTSAI